MQSNLNINCIDSSHTYTFGRRIPQLTTRLVVFWLLPLDLLYFALAVLHVSLCLL